MAAAFEASLAALIVVLGYGLATGPPRLLDDDRDPRRRVVGVAALGFVAVALLDWSLRDAFDLPTVATGLAFAAVALAAVAAANGFRNSRP